MLILGISAFFHDSAACLIRNGEIMAAAQEERFTRKKHENRFPVAAIDFCLRHSKITIQDIDIIVFYDKPFLKFSRLLVTSLNQAPNGLSLFLESMPVWLSEKLRTRQTLRRHLQFQGKVLFTEHHESHAASAFFPSPFDSAAILTIDGVGEWATSSYGFGQDNEIHLLSELHFPNSLGLLYSSFTGYIGFKVNSGEYKLMGLAPYGEPVYLKTIMEELADLREDGSLRLNMKYFNYTRGLSMTNESFNHLFGGLPRRPESPITKREMDLARSVQVFTEEAMLRMARHVQRETGKKNLCLAGGVALNCVGNGRILRETPFENVWVQPAADDAGGAVGAALSVWYQYCGNERISAGKTCDVSSDYMKGSYLGPDFSNEQIQEFLDSISAKYTRLSPLEIPERAAELIADGKIVGWFQGRMEFGPRALGGRSILADPRSPDMQSKLNLKIKFRESFRPFAPSVLAERAEDFFEMDYDSPYMLFVTAVRSHLRLPVEAKAAELFASERFNLPRSTIPAVTHIDYSARVQTVRREQNPRYYDLIAAFEKLTGVPIVINTSFNVRGEPIVCTPQEAYQCFMRTGMDFLIMEDFLISKCD